MSAAQDYGPEYEDYVPVHYARNAAEAEFYKTLLEDHGIPVELPLDALDEIETPDDPKGLPVLVPEEHLSEAEEVIAQRAEIEEEFTEQYQDDDDLYDDDEDDEYEDDDYDDGYGDTDDDADADADADAYGNADEDEEYF